MLGEGAGEGGGGEVGGVGGDEGGGDGGRDANGQSKAAGPPPPFEILDDDVEGASVSIDVFESFFVQYMEVDGPEHRKRARRIFRKLDVNDSGKLDQVEFLQVLNILTDPAASVLRHPVGSNDLITHFAAPILMNYRFEVLVDIVLTFSLLVTLTLPYPW